MSTAPDEGGSARDGRRSDDAGFVQIMTGRAEPAKVRPLHARVESDMSEADARATEKGEPPAVLTELQAVMPVEEFLDLPDPWLD